MDLFLAAFLSGSVVAPTLPYTPADSDRPPINTPQTSPSDNPTESWEQKILRRYGRRAA